MNDGFVSEVEDSSCCSMLVDTRLQGMDVYWDWLRSIGVVCRARQSKGQPAERKTESCRLKDLPHSVVGRLWPGLRLVLGLRVCKWLRGVLLAQAQQIQFHGYDESFTNGEKGNQVDDIVNDLLNFRSNQAGVVLKIGGRFPNLIHALNRAVASGLRMMELDHRASMGKDESPVLVQTLSMCTNLAVLKLRLESSKVWQVADALKDCTTLVSLYVGISSFPPDPGPAAVGAMVARLPLLQRLALHTTWVRAEGAEILADGLRKAGQSLQCLDMSGGNLQAQGMAALAQGLRACEALAHLNLSGNSLGSEGTALLSAALVRCTALTSLMLNTNSIPASAAPSLASLVAQSPRLRALHLSKNSIGAGGIAVLGPSFRHASSLSCLDLSHNALGQAGMAPLASSLTSCAALRHLDVSNNEIGDRGAACLAPALRHCVSLSCLSVSENVIGSEGAAALAAAVRACHRLENLQMRSNRMGDLGATSMAGAMAVMPRLRSISVADNGIGDLGATQLASALRRCSKLEVLGLSKNAVAAPGMWEVLAGIRESSSLRWLQIEGNPAMSAEEGARLQEELLSM